MKKPMVAIVDLRDKEVFAGVKQAVDLLGGMGRFVKPGDLVFLKPNMFIGEKDYTTGLITDPRVTIAAARMAKEAGGRVVVGERTKNPLLIFAAYPEIYEYAEVISLDDAPHYHGHLFGARHLEAVIPIPKIIDECDVFINLPGLRTHMLPRMSNGMKNLMGLMPGDATRLVHKFGLEGSIVDLNCHRPSDLAITDAVYSLQGNFPGVSRPARTDLIMAADNVVAADVVAALAMGLDPAELPFLVEAGRRGLGPIDAGAIEIRGEQLGFARDRIRLEQTEISFEPFRERVTIVDQGACPACRRALIGGLTNLRLTRPDVYETLGPETHAVVIGPAAELPDLAGREVLCYGNCTYKHRHAEHRQYEFGCPPLAGQVSAGFSKIHGRGLRPKIGYCSLGMRDLQIEEVVRRIAALGYQGIELWYPHLEDYERRHGELGSLRALLEEAGLEPVLIAPYFTLAQKVEETEASLERAKKAVEYAHALGTNKVRAFVGGPPSAESAKEHWDRAVDGLRRICELDRQVRFVLETHDGQLQDTANSTLKLLRQTGRENLRVNLDIFNLFLQGEDPVAALERLHPAVENIHLKNGRLLPDGKREACLLAEGDLDYRPFFARLRELGYNGYACMEWFGGDPEEAARREIAYLRGVFAV